MEESTPNFDESFYSETKGYMEQMLKCYPNSLILRVRMPISDDLFHRNFVTKIAKYERIVNIPNSMTVLYEMLPASLAMAKKGLLGVYNFCNPGVVSHNELDATKLMSALPEDIKINDIKTAVELCMQRMATNLTAEYGPLPDSLPQEVRKN